MLSESEIAARWREVTARMAAALERAGRPSDACRLVLASKTQPAEAILAAYRAGARVFGENYVQEAIAKQASVGRLDGASWHLIGHLQSNKARLAAAHFDLIQSLDSVRTAAALARASARPGVRVLIEVNLGGEASKSGVAPDALAELLEKARDLVQIEGFMTIPPPGPQGAARHYFAALRNLRDRLATSAMPLRELSMGMTDDYEIAIEVGATIVRVGRAVFGER